MTDHGGDSPGVGQESVAGRPQNLTWSVFKNTATLVGGRGLVTLGRFAIAALVIRTSGAERFGEYSLVIGLLALCEWVVDFGFVDIFVREICRAPEREEKLLQVTTRAKITQVIAGYLLLLGVLLVMSYPAPVVRAALIGGIGIFFYGGITVYRTLFKVHLTLEREVAAESLSIIALVGSLAIACSVDASLTVMTACFAGSRGIHFIGVWLMGRREFPLGIHLVERGDLRQAFRQTLPLGITGICIVLYDQLEPLMLSKLADFRAVGLFSGAQRFFLPVLLVLSSLGMSMYPVLSSSWHRRMGEFRQQLQLGTDLAMVLGGAVFCLFQIGAGLLLRLLGQEMEAAAPVLRVMAWVLFLRTITTVVGPVVVIAGMQAYTLWIAGLALAGKTLLLLLLIPSHGYVGAAYACLVAELLCGFLPTVLVVQWLAEVRFRLGVLVRLVVVAAVSIGVPAWLGLADSILGMLIAGTLYVPCSLAAGAIRMSQVRSLAMGIRKRFEA